MIEEIANTFLLQHSCVSLSYGFVPIQGEPFACVRHSPHQLISGRVQPVPKSLMRIARARAPRGMGPFSSAASFSPSPVPVTHPPPVNASRLSSRTEPRASLGGGVVG